MTNRLVIHHRVKDYKTWKPVFDQQKTARDQAGLRTLDVVRTGDAENDLIIDFEVNDYDRARAFVESDDLKKAMDRAGVIGRPEVFFGETKH